MYMLTNLVLSTSWVLYLRIEFLFSVGVDICRLSIALRIGSLVKLFLYLVDVDKPQGLYSIIQNKFIHISCVPCVIYGDGLLIMFVVVYIQTIG
jgi:hypothetical protein